MGDFKNSFTTAFGLLWPFLMTVLVCGGVFFMGIRLGATYQRNVDEGFMKDCQENKVSVCSCEKEKADE